ncbi:MAG TPA: hypothetical protein VIM71_14515, partial [Lacunisphaera sp.]
MNDDQRFSTLFSIVMILATAMLGWISLKEGPSPRMADNRSSAPVPADEQDVIARLWEDPLQAVQPEAVKTQNSKDASGVPSEKHTVRSLAAAIKEKTQSFDSSRVGLMVVPIPDTPFPDDIETRLRLRYSVQVALADNDYAPDNRNYLGYFRLDSATSNPSQAPNGPVVPYEWFVPRRSHQGAGQKRQDTAILVLWLPESQLARAPLQLLSHLRKQLTCPLDDREFCGIFVIGPQSSDTLKALVRDARARSQGPGLPELQGKLAIFSAQATAADALIELEPRAPWSLAREQLAELLQQAVVGPAAAGQSGTWRYFYNFIATDDQLTDLLAAELSLRGISCANDRILILAEADTTYGRSLPVAFEASLETRKTAEPAVPVWHTPLETATPESIARRQKQTQGEAGNPHLLIYRYLRGLDQQKGQPQNSEKSPRTNAKTPEEALTAALNKQGPMALGESQLDYVDRLVQEIQQGAPSRSDVKAVGVLGADIYDKLILLRSLRSKFPDALFFTTDLDARMWHPDHLPFTRNVVVASASDVRATTADQNASRIPPFRDVYQATVFRACGAALRMAENGDGEKVPGPRAPAIFELGRNGPTQLQIFPSSSPVLNRPELSRPQKAGAITIIVGLAVALALWNWNYRTQKRPFTLFSFWVGASAILLAGFTYAARYNFSSGPAAEPWALGAGLSIWPTEILRLVISCLVIATLLWAARKQAEFHTTLKKNHFIEQSGEVGSVATGLLRVENLVEEYERNSRIGPRVFRVVAATLAYMALGFGLVFLVDGAMPIRTHIRGDFARDLDKIFLIVSITCFLGLVFYVLDSVLVTARLLAKISEPTAWPKKLLEATRRQ